MKSFIAPMRREIIHHCIAFDDDNFVNDLTLDATDLRLLDLLQHDASLSNQDLAAAAHVSPATCLRRVRRLVEAGVIERRVALLSHERLGHGLTAVVEVTLDRQGAEHLDAFERARWPKPRCSSATACRPGRTSCWWCGWPTCRPTTRWCSACSRRTPTCAT